MSSLVVRRVRPRDTAGRAPAVTLFSRAFRAPGHRWGIWRTPGVKREALDGTDPPTRAPSTRDTAHRGPPRRARARWQSARRIKRRIKRRGPHGWVPGVTSSEAAWSVKARAVGTRSAQAVLCGHGDEVIDQRRYHSTSVKGMRTMLNGNGSFAWFPRRARASSYSLERSLKR